MAAHARPISYLLSSALCQLAGFSIAFALAQSLVWLPASIVLVVQCIVAGSVSVWLRHPLAWRVFNICIPPLVILFAHVSIPNWIAMSIAALFVLLYLPTLWTGVPLYPTSRQMYDIILKELPTDRDFTFLDLGCGTGKLLTFLSAHRPRGRFVGVEISILPYLTAALRAKLSPAPRPQVVFGDFWQIDLKSFDFVYAFLAPGPMTRLWQKVKSQMRPGSIFFTNSFQVGEIPQRAIAAHDERECVLHVHHL